MIFLNLESDTSFLNWEGTREKMDLGKAEEPGQIANIHRITEKAREFQKNICFCLTMPTLDCVYHSKLWKILLEMGISDHLTCLLKQSVCRSRRNS